MILRNNYTKTADVKRTVETTDANNFVKSEFSTVHSDIPCHLQPTTGELTQDRANSFGKNYTMFCDPIEIREGDRVDIDSDEYRVVGVESYKWKGVEKHMEVLLRIWG